MRKIIAIVALLLCTGPFAPAQDKSPDSQTLRDLLNEVRLLRRDLQTTSVAAQRVQIVLYRLQLQDAATGRASRAVQEAQDNLTQLRSNRQVMSARLKRLEDDDNHDPIRRQQVDEAKKQISAELDRLAKDEEQWQARSNDAEAHLRTEQSKLDGLHSLLDELEQALANVGKASGPAR